MKTTRAGTHEPGLRQAGAPDAAAGPTQAAFDAQAANISALVQGLTLANGTIATASANAVSAFNSAIAANDAAAAAAGQASSAQTAANTAQVTADGAQAAADAAAAAAAAAAADAAAASAAAAAATAAGAPVSLDEHFRARFKSLNPAGRPSFMFDELERCYSPGVPVGEVGGWLATGSAIYTDERGSSVKCPGGGPGTNNAIYRGGAAATSGQRTKKWHMGGAAEFVGTVGAGSGEWRAFMLINAPGNLPDYMIGMGLFADVSEEKFSWRVVGDNGVVSALSTIDYSAGLHILEMWTIPDPGNGNVVYMWGSVDEEEPILIGNLRNNMPDGPLYQWHGTINGADTMYLGAVCIQSER
jgi:hypothetical protein